MNPLTFADVRRAVRLELDDGRYTKLVEWLPTTDDEAFESFERPRVDYLITPEELEAVRYALGGYIDRCYGYDRSLARLDQPPLAVLMSALEKLNA